MKRSLGSTLLAVLITSLVSLSAHAQATRTWVSGVGDDVNPCSRTAPCKTFAGAISKTASGGIIDALDPAGFGAITITKPITIEGTGTLASILHSGVQGVIVNITSGTNRNVVLRDLLIDGAGTTLGTNGISIFAADNVTIENCRIANDSGVGVNIAPSTGVSNLSIHISNTMFYNIGAGGVLVKAMPGATTVGTRLAIVNSEFRNPGNYGIRAEAYTDVTADRIRVSSAKNHGIIASTSTGPVAFNLTNSVIQGTRAASFGNGVTASGTGASVRVSDNDISDCVVGLNPELSGVVFTYNDNRLMGNSTDTSPGTITPVSKR